MVNTLMTYFVIIIIVNNIDTIDKLYFHLSYVLSPLSEIAHPFTGYVIL